MPDATYKSDFPLSSFPTELIKCVEEKKNKWQRQEKLRRIDCLLI